MKNLVMRWVLFLMILLKSITSFAQDHLYSEFFNSPLYLNPALTGQFKADLRVDLIYRNQWTNVPGPLSYFTGSIDYNIPRLGGGIGLLFTRGSEGTAYLDKTNFSALYSYSVGSEDFVLSFGLQAGMTNRTIDYGKLIFANQIDPTLGIIPGSSNAGDLPFNNKFYFDTGVGTNLAIGDFNIGAAVQHINQPNESFTGMPDKLPMRINTHVSYRLDLNSMDNMDDDDKTYVIPSVVFYKQSNFDSYSVGVQYKRRGVNVGVSYRSGAETGPSALVLSLIFDIFVNRDGAEKFRFGVSHDSAVQGLTYGNTAGSTEGSLGYETTLPSNGNNDPPRFEGAHRCYEFY
ncbi:PorP/SprF family type IX secretion system membrane protein [Mucilaginibacter sp. McL0603]|uniref:PorP/SprF family type IX secretion system membrane protein n=1 Tax=Mucilaginibacter sp. McL0603 TaxID=3415670 RepID=UPI003CEEDF8F